MTSRCWEAISIVFLPCLFLLNACVSYSVSDINRQGKVEPPVLTQLVSNNNKPKEVVQVIRNENGRITIEDIREEKTEKIPSNAKAKKASIEENDAETFTLSDLPPIKLDRAALEKAQHTDKDELIVSELSRIMAEFGEMPEEVPSLFLSEVKAYINIFQTEPKYRKFFVSSLKRSRSYLPAAKSVFTERGIPMDMAYIALVESGFNRVAKSRAGALGVWQFMPATARDYSLTVNARTDDRIDFVKSTYAAVDYFHDLLAIFGPRSFLLAIAAYNCGENRIIACLKKIEDPFEHRDFWHIRSCLPRETQEYPPKVIAAAIIGNNPMEFGFPEPEEDGEEVEFPPPVRLIQIKKATATLQGKKKNNIERKDTARYEQITVVRKEPIESNRRLTIYTTKKGNTIPMVAKAFDVKKENIQRWNGIKGDAVKPGTKLKIYTTVQVDAIHYHVKKGDSITEISQAFGVRPINIIVCNGLKNGLDLKAGLALVFYRRTSSKTLVHTVAVGSNLTQIATRYKVKTRDVMMWNNLDSSIIQPEQKLKIYTDRTREM